MGCCGGATSRSGRRRGIMRRRSNASTSVLMSSRRPSMKNRCHVCSGHVTFVSEIDTRTGVSKSTFICGVCGKTEQL